jgi:hypothetical protein
MALKRYTITGAEGRSYTAQLSDADAAAYGDAAVPLEGGSPATGPAEDMPAKGRRRVANKARTPEDK